jgi:hypothetical protein
MESLSPCPECGGRRVMFHCDTGSGYPLHIPVSRPFIPSGLQLYACTCLGCGHTTLRIHPNDLERLRQEAEKEEGRPSGF